MKQPTKFPSRYQLGAFANAAGLQIKSTGSFTSTHTITWAKHHGCFEAAERMQRAFQHLGYTVDLNHTDSNPYGTGSLKLALPMLLDAAIKSALAAAIKSALAAAMDEDPMISYVHATVVTEFGPRRDIKFVLGMRKAAQGFAADSMFSAMTRIHRHVVEATSDTYGHHVVMAPTSWPGRSNLAMIISFNVKPAADAVKIEVQTTRNRK